MWCAVRCTAETVLLCRLCWPGVFCSNCCRYRGAEGRQCGKRSAPGKKNARQAAIKVAERVIGKVHPGHMLQSEPEEVIYKEAPGWDAITECFEKRYPDQKIPAHFGCYASYKPDEMGPLDGISVYNGGDYFHFVTYGLSELYEKQNGNPERSGYGFELTLKLKKEGLENPALEVRHICSLLQMIAGITVNNGHQFTPGQFLAMGAAERSGCRIEICDHRIYHQGG